MGASKRNSTQGWEDTEFLHTLALAGAFVFAGFALIFYELPYNVKFAVVIISGGTGVISYVVYCRGQRVIRERGIVSLLPEPQQRAIREVAFSSLNSIMVDSYSYRQQMMEVFASLFLPLTNEERGEAIRALPEGVSDILQRPLIANLPPAASKALFPRLSPTTAPVLPVPALPPKPVLPGTGRAPTILDDVPTTPVKPNRPTTVPSRRLSEGVHCPDTDEKFHADGSFAPPGESSSASTPLPSSSPDTSRRRISGASSTSTGSGKKAISLFGVTFKKKPIYGYLLDAKMADFSLTFGPRMGQYMMQKLLKDISTRQLQIMQFGSLVLLLMLVRRQQWVRRMLVSGAKASVLFGTLATVFITSSALLARRDREKDDAEEKGKSLLDTFRDWLERARKFFDEPDK